MQSFFSPLGALANENSQPEDFTLTPSDLTLDEEGKGMAILTWNYSAAERTEDKPYNFNAPEEFVSVDEQNGDLLIGEQIIGNYTVNTDGSISVTVLAHTEELSGSGSITITGEADADEETPPAESDGSEEPVQTEEPKDPDQAGEPKDPDQSEEPKDPGEAGQNGAEETPPSENPSETDPVTDEETSAEEGTEDIDAIKDEAEEKDNQLQTEPNTDINEEILTNATLTFKNSNDETVNEVTRETTIIVDYDWSLPNGHGYTDGATYHFKVPSELAIYEAVNTEIMFDNQSIGTFTVDLAGNATVVFNQFIEERSNIQGTLQVLTNIRETTTVTEDRIVRVTPIEGKASVDIPIKYEPSGNTIDKQGVPNRSYNTDEITWTVNVNKHLNNIENAVFTDPIPNGLQLQEDSVEVYKLNTKLNGSVERGEKVNVSLEKTADGGDFRIQLGNINSAYQITFKTDVTDQEGTSFKNGAFISGDDYAEQKAEASVGVQRGKPLEKRSAHYDAITQTITWEIKYNYNEKPITAGNAVLTDLFDDTQTLVEDSFDVREITIDQNGNEAGAAQVDENAYAVTKLPAADGKNGFTFKFQENINKAYKITYKTKAIDRVFNNTEIANKVTYGDISAEGKRWISQQILSKGYKGANYQTKRASWEIVFNKDKYPMTDVFLTDTFPNEGLEFIKDTLVIKGEKEYEEGEDYNVELTANGFNIDFLKDVAEQVTITYATTFNYEARKDKNSKKLENKALLTWTDEENNSHSKEADASFEPDSYTQSNGFKSGSYNAVTKEITWKVGINYNLKQLEEAEVVDFINEDQKLDRESLTVSRMSLTGGANGIIVEDLVKDEDYTVEWDPENKQGFKVKFKEAINSPYQITFNTSLEDKLIKSSYSNTATLNNKGEKVTDLTASVSVNNGGSYAKKSGGQNGKIIDWKVNINFGQSTVSDVKIFDTPSSNQKLLQNSFELYETTVDSGGNVAKGAKLDPEEYTLTINEGDDGEETFEILFKNQIDSPYILEYQSMILAKVGDTIKNDVDFTGKEITDEVTESVSSIVVKRTTGMGTGEGVLGSLTVTKVDRNDESKKLSGAVFTLLDADSGAEIASGETDQNGEITFDRLLLGTYLLKEDQAPEGYVVGINDTEAVTLEQEVTEKVIKNDKIITDVQLIKEDKENQKLLQGAEFELHKKEGSEYVKQGSYVTDENGSIVVKDLEPGDYQFIEVKAPEFYVLNADPVSFTIDDDQIQTKQVKKQNERGKGKLTIQKVDSATEEPLKDAEFKIYDSQNNVSRTLKTNEDGIAEFLDLP
ncbi:collagen binding domain-containing protein [Cytobacillus gottheilii]|uniref:collagen binding domain-containing protein n=1 Tax=Cytobacillus gottheilii TaxID=859144 RepID=UPI003464A270